MRIPLALSLCLFASVLLTPLAVQGATGDVVAQFATPGRCPTGLAFDGRSLWLADRRSDRLDQIDPRDGHVIRSLPAPGYQIEGLAFDGTHLWALDVREKKLHRLNPATGLVESQLPVYCEKPQGLAFDGKYLWIADRGRKLLRQISTDDGTEISHVPTPSNGTSGLTFDGKYLWVADRFSDELFMVCPKNGWVVVTANSPSKYPRGLAFDGQHLWNVDYQSDTLYKIVRQDETWFVHTPIRKQRLEFVQEVHNRGPGDVTSLDVYLAVPRDLPTQRLLGPLKFTPEPREFLTDQWGQRSAHFHFENVPPSRRVIVTMEADVELSTVRYSLFPDTCGSLADVPQEILNRYLGDAPKLGVADPHVQKTARQVVGDESNCYWIARRLFEYLGQKMTFIGVGGWEKGSVALRRGSGSCSEYTFAYVALCRAVGLPARYVGAVCIHRDDASTDFEFHRWPQVYLPNHGWVSIDVSCASTEKSPKQNAAAFGRDEGGTLITTIGGGGSEHLDWQYNSNVHWRCQSPCTVETTRFGEWEPAPVIQTPKSQ